MVSGPSRVHHHHVGLMEAHGVEFRKDVIVAVGARKGQFSVEIGEKQGNVELTVASYM